MDTLARTGAMTFERGVFLALLLVLLLVVARLFLSWPPMVATEDARLDYREPERVPEAGAALPATAFQDHDLLVPYELTVLSPLNLQTQAPRPPVVIGRPQRPTPRPDGEVALKPKVPAKPPVAVKQPEAPATPEARRLPLSIKGVINFSGLGFRLLTVDEDGGYHRMQEGDEFPYLGETYTIKKITADGAVFVAPDGSLVVLKNDFDFAKAVEEQGSGAPRPGAARPAPAPNGQGGAAGAPARNGGGNRGAGNRGGNRGATGKGGNGGTGRNAKGGVSATDLQKLAKQFGGGKVNVNDLLRGAKSGGVDVGKLMQEASKRGLSPQDLQKFLGQ